MKFIIIFCCVFLRLDQTATGHVLGRAEGRQPVASPERGLSPIECAIVRLFTHMAMYLGASINQQVRFLRSHIQRVHKNSR